MLFPAAKFGDMIIGIDAHTILVPAPPSPAPIPVPFIPHPFIGTIFLWHAPLFPASNVFINNMPACTVGAKSLSAHFPTPPGIWWLKPPCCLMKWFLTHVGTVVLSTVFSAVVTAVGAATGTLTPTTRAPKSLMKPSPENPSFWQAFSGQLASQNWMSIFRAILPPVVLPIAEGDVSLGSPTVTVNGAPLAFVGPLTAGSCTEIPIVPNANVLGFSNVMVGVTAMELISQLAWNAIQGLAGLMASKVASRFASKVSGEPIDIVSGANFDDRVDFELPGPIPFTWKRYYTSLFVRNSILGWCWTHEYHRYLSFGDDWIVYTDHEGRDHRFPRLTDDKPGFELKREGLNLRRAANHSYEMTQRDGIVMVFEFNGLVPQAMMTELKDANGNVLQLFYDKEQHLVKIIDSAARQLVFDYHGNGKIQHIRCVGDAEQETDVRLISYEYDKDDNLIAFLDPIGNRYSYEYDKRHFMTKKTDRRGYSFHYEYDEKGQCVKSYGDDGLYSVQMQYLPSVNMTIVKVPNGGTYTYRYNELNLVIQETDPYQKVKISGYDEDANLITEIDENGNAKAYKYDDRGNRVEETDILGNQSQAQFDAWNKEAVKTDPVGASCQKEYDERGNLVKETTPAGAMTEHSYDEHGRKIETIKPDGTVLGFDYYPNGMLKAMLDESGNEIESYEYDILGNRTAVIVGGLRTEFVYDKLSRLVKVKYPDGRVEQNVFDAEGNIIQYINKRGAGWKYRYDSWNKLVEEIDPEENVTKYSYNKADEIEKVIDPNGNITEYQYDLCDRLSHVVRNGKLKEEYIRDGAGNLIEKRTSSSESLLKAIIGPNNLAEKKIWGDDEANFEYDPLGRISKAEIGETSLERVYDVGGRLVLDKQNNHQVEHQFDELGRPVKTIVDDFEVSLEYGDDGSVLIQDSLGQAHELSYEGNWLTSRLLACEVKESFEYDDSGRLIKQIRSQSGNFGWCLRITKFTAETQRSQRIVAKQYKKSRMSTKETRIVPIIRKNLWLISAYSASLR